MVLENLSYFDPHYQSLIVTSTANHLNSQFTDFIKWCQRHTLGELLCPENINRLRDIPKLNLVNSEPVPVSNYTVEQIQDICARYESLKQCVLTIKEFVESGKTEAEWQTFISDEIVPLLDG
jgi:catalase (peroxidase I)